jgi:hypothetical protein
MKKIVDGKEVDVPADEEIKILSERADEELLIPEQRATEVRTERDMRLAESDWTQLNNAALTPPRIAQWAAQRQSLRELPDHVNFPFLNPEDWPVKPV